MTRRNRDLFAALEELQGGACGICDARNLELARERLGFFLEEATA